MLNLFTFSIYVPIMYFGQFIKSDNLLIWSYWLSPGLDAIHVT